MKMWRFKSCSRCGGDTYVDGDAGGWYEHCLMCGHTRDLPAEAIAQSKSTDDSSRQKVADGADSR